jgi:hypothetical protein
VKTADIVIIGSGSLAQDIVYALSQVATGSLRIAIIGRSTSYSMLKKNVKLRKEIADRIGVGFELPQSILAPVVPIVAETRSLRLCLRLHPVKRSCRGLLSVVPGFERQNPETNEWTDWHRRRTDEPHRSCHCLEPRFWTASGLCG